MENNPMNLFNSILSNPDAIKNIKDIINNTNNNTNVNNEEKTADHKNEINSPLKNSDLSFIENLLKENQDGELIRKINSAYDVYANKSTPSINLLEALSPYISPKRAVNLNRIKIAVRISNAVSEFNKK